MMSMVPSSEFALLSVNRRSMYGFRNIVDQKFETIRERRKRRKVERGNRKRGR